MQTTTDDQPVKTEGNDPPDKTEGATTVDQPVKTEGATTVDQPVKSEQVIQAITVDQPVKSQRESVTRRRSLLQRIRRSVTSVFRRRSTRKRTKSDPQIGDIKTISSNSDENINKRASLTNEPSDDINNDQSEISDSPAEPNFRPIAKVPVVISAFTNELKQSLQLRSRKIDDGEKSPTEAIKQLEDMRILSFIVDEEVSDVNNETEVKTFEEKVALFESQISSTGNVAHSALRKNNYPRSCSVGDNNTQDNRYFEEKQKKRVSNVSGSEFVDNPSKLNDEEHIRSAKNISKEEIMIEENNICTEEKEENGKNIQIESHNDEETKKLLEETEDDSTKVHKEVMQEHANDIRKEAINDGKKDIKIEAQDDEEKKIIRGEIEEDSKHLCKDEEKNMQIEEHKDKENKMCTGGFTSDENNSLCNKEIIVEDKNIHREVENDENLLTGALKYNSESDDKTASVCSVEHILQCDDRHDGDNTNVEAVKLSFIGTEVASVTENEEVTDFSKDAVSATVCVSRNLNDEDHSTTESKSEDDRVNVTCTVDVYVPDPVNMAQSNEDSLPENRSGVAQ